MTRDQKEVEKGYQTLPQARYRALNNGDTIVKAVRRRISAERLSSSLEETIMDRRTCPRVLKRRIIPAQ